MKLEYYYDRHTRSWITQVKDDRGFEIESHYDGNKISRDYTIETLRDQYKIAKINVIHWTPKRRNKVKEYSYLIDISQYDRDQGMYVSYGERIEVDTLEEAEKIFDSISIREDECKIIEMITREDGEIVDCDLVKSEG